LDSDGIVNEPLRIRLKMTVEGSRMVLDFTGSSPCCAGPFNAPISTTISACHVALKHIFLDTPINAGAFVPVEIVVPEGCFLNAAHPRPLSGAAAEVSQRLIDVVTGLFAQLTPKRI